MKTLSPLALLLAALACSAALGSSHASSGEPKKKVPQKAMEKKAKEKTAAGKRTAAKSGAAEKDVEIAGMHAMPYDCDLGDKLTIYRKPEDDQKIALHWKKKMHHMTRMHTTTGAERFENAEKGLVWIGIPAKGMLLDSKKGRQLANECRNEAQKNEQKKEAQNLTQK